MRILKILFVTNHFGWTSGSPTNCYSFKKKSNLILDLVRMMAQSAPKRQRRMEQRTNKIFATQSLKRILSLVVDACVITSCRLVFALFCWASGSPPFCSHRRRHIHSHGRRHFLTRCVGAFPLDLWEALLFAATVVVTSFRLVLALVRWTSGRPPLCSRRRHHILLPGVGVVALDRQTKIKTTRTANPIPLIRNCSMAGGTSLS